MDTITGLQNAVDYIENNLCDELDPQDVAAKAYLSAFHFNRLFSAVCGMPPGEYIRARRLTLAGTELRETRRKVIDIALQYGYESPESFSRAFSRFHGISPQAARSGDRPLHSVPPLSIQSILGGSKMIQELKDRGYTVRENAPVYYTQNMDKTAKWFEDVLGWYSQIDKRDENGDGEYGCVVSIPEVILNMTQAPFSGIHLLRGEPSQQVMAYMVVDNIAALHTFVLSRGWQTITDLVTQPWGTTECSVTTVDGSILRFMQIS